MGTFYLPVYLCFFFRGFKNLDLVWDSVRIPRFSVAHFSRQ